MKPENPLNDCIGSLKEIFKFPVWLSRTIEVISGLTGIPGQERNRFLLGQVYQSVVSGVSHLSRGRRELGRRFVPLANAAALFRKKPTHFSYFGGSSVSDAVQGAVSK